MSIDIALPLCVSFIGRGTAGWLHYELFFSHLLLLLSVGVMKKPRIWQSLESEVWFTLQVSLFWGTHAPWIHAGYGLHSNIHRSPFSADNAVWQTDRQRDRIVVAYTVLDACSNASFCKNNWFVNTVSLSQCCCYCRCLPSRQLL